MTTPRSRHLAASRLALALLLLASFCCTSSLGRVLTWSQQNGGNLQSASNWDGGVVPADGDDVVIQLKDAATRNGMPIASNPWDSSSDLGGGSHSDSNLFTLTQPWSVRSISVGGPASLVFDTQVHVSTSVQVGGRSTVYVRGGQLEAGSIEVADGGTLSLDLAQIGNAQGSTTPLRVASGGKLVASSLGGSNHLSNVVVTLRSGAIGSWNAGPLVMDATTLAIEQGATFYANADTLTQGDPRSATSIKNSGQLVFNSTLMGGGAQMCGVPVWNAASGHMVVTGLVGPPAELRIVNSLKHDGLLTVSGSRTLSLSFETADFNEGSRSVLGANGTIWCQSGETKFKGRIQAEDGVTEGGELLVASLVTQDGTVDVNRLTLKGGVLHTGDHSTTSARNLVWQSGNMVGTGIVNVGRTGGSGSLTLTEASSSKVLSGPKLHIYGVATIEPSNALLMQASSVLHVAPSAKLIHESQSQLQSGDDTAVMLTLDAESRWEFHTRGSPTGRAQNLVTVPVASQANLVVSGDGEAAFRRNSRFLTLSTEDTAGVRLQGQSNNTQFVFTDPISLPGEGQYLLLQTAHVDLQSEKASTVHGLALLDGDLTTRAPLQVDTLTLGSPTASSVLQGKGPVNANFVRFQAGEVNVEQMNVATEFLMSTNGAKQLNLANLTFLGGSSSRIVASETRVADRLHWWVHANATIALESTAHLHANRPADHTGQPCLHIDGRLIWRGAPGQQTTSMLEIMNRNEMVVELMSGATPSTSATPAAAPYEAIIMGGLSSAPRSSLSVSSGCLVTSSCPANMTSSFGCTFGLVTGLGKLALAIGKHSMAAPVNISYLALDNGRNEFFEQARVEHLDITDGELILHGYAFARRLSVRGGRLVGFPVLRSALVVLPSDSNSAASSGALLTHNTTLSLSGLTLICEGSCESRGRDLVLNGGAQLVVARGGRLAFTTAAVVQFGSAGGGNLLNAGELAFATTSSAELDVRVPLLNRGLVIVKSGCSLTLANSMRQDAPAAKLMIERGGKLTKSDGGALELDTGELQSDGVLVAHVQIGGRLVHAQDSPPSDIQGDVVFAPSASISSHCTGQSCSVLTSNGTVYLNGLANLTYSGAAAGVGRANPLLTARAVIGTFRDSASGAVAGGVRYELAYTALGATANVNGLADSSALAVIPAFYEMASHQSVSAVLQANLSPSPTDIDALSFSSTDMDASDPHSMHHMHRRDPNDPTSPEVDPTVDPTPIVVPAESTDRSLRAEPRGALGMSHKGAEGLVIFFIVLVALLLVATGALIQQWLRARARLDEREKKQAQAVADAEAQRPAATAPQGIRRTLTRHASQLESDPSSSSASPDAVGPGHALVASGLPKRVTRQSAARNLFASVAAPPLSESENEAEEGASKPERDAVI